MVHSFTETNNFHILMPVICGCVLRRAGVGWACRAGETLCAMHDDTHTTSKGSFYKLEIAIIITVRLLLLNFVSYDLLAHYPKSDCVTPSPPAIPTVTHTHTHTHTRRSANSTQKPQHPPPYSVSYLLSLAPPPPHPKSSPFPSQP